MSRIPLSGLVLLVLSGAVQARDVQVDGYFRRDGTYVPPHHRTAPDSSRWNNYGTQGNINPYTGRQGEAPLYDLNPSAIPTTPAPLYPRHDYRR